MLKLNQSFVCSRTHRDNEDIIRFRNCFHKAINYHLISLTLAFNSFQTFLYETPDLHVSLSDHYGKHITKPICLLQQLNFSTSKPYD